MPRTFNPARRFVLLWNSINALLLLLVFAHQSTSPDVLGRYTRSYVAGIGLSLALILLVLLFSRWWQQRVVGWLASLPETWGFVIPFALLVGTTILWLVPYEAYAVKLLITFNAASFGLWLVFALARDGSAARSRVWTWLLLATLVGVLLVSLFSAHGVPEEQSSGDEASWTDYAVTWLDTGNIYYRIMDKQPVAITPGVGYWLIPYAGWLRVFGVSLASGRLFIWVLYALAAISITCAGWQLYDRWIGLLAGICAAASPFVLENRIIRPEIGLPILGALLLVVLSRRRLLWAALAGGLAVLSLEVHAAGLAYIAGAAGVYVTDLFLRRDDPLRFQRLLCFAAGGLLGVGIYVLTHILVLPDPAAFFTTLRGERSFLSFAGWSGYLRALDIYWERAPLEMIFLAVGFAGGLLRRMKNDRLLLRFAVFCLLGYLVLVPGAERYLIVFAPFVYIGIAALARYGFARVPAPPRLAGSAIMVFCLCAPFFAVSLPNVRLNLLAADSMPALVQHVRELSDRSALIFGDINTYWWFRDYAGFRANNSEYDHSRDALQSPEAIWSRKPDVVFFTPYPGTPNLPPILAQLLQNDDYRLVESFISGGFATTIWLRPGYSPETVAGAMLLATSDATTIRSCEADKELSAEIALANS